MEQVIYLFKVLLVLTVITVQKKNVVVLDMIKHQQKDRNVQFILIFLELAGTLLLLMNLLAQMEHFLIDMVGVMMLKIVLKKNVVIRNL